MTYLDSYACWHEQTLSCATLVQSENVMHEKFKHVRYTYESLKQVIYHIQLL